MYKLREDEEVIKKVWAKGTVVSNNDPNIWRKDACGAWIKREKYGDRDSIYGWEIDHINPDGGDGLSNLRPLHWKNNIATSDGTLKCVITSSGPKNVEK